MKIRVIYWHKQAIEEITVNDIKYKDDCISYTCKVGNVIEEKEIPYNNFLGLITEG